MNTHKVIGFALTVGSICAMLVLFVMHVSTQWQTLKPAQFSVRYGNIAYGYPTGIAGCQGGAPNGIVVSGEDCDDGNNTNGDGCSTQCTVETGWSCTDVVGQKSTCSPICGDGLVKGTEQCDPGVAGESSTCNSDCTTSACGDGKLNKTAGEECDNGSGNSATGTCNTSCKKTFCGDGIVQSMDGQGIQESCEPSLDSTCSASCTIQNGIGISITPVDSSGSTPTRLGPPASCGNGTVEPDKGEQCDDGRFNGLDGKCDRWCHALYCGNGTVDPGEECEPERDANGNFTTNKCGLTCSIPTCDANGTCTGGCQWINIKCTPFNSSSSESSSVDIQTQIGLGIEKQTQFSSEKASSESTSTPSFILPVSSESASFTSVAPGPAVCGDGTTQNGEQCDDGTANSDTTPGACRTNCTLPRCGDGVIDPGEQCDRGDVNNAIGNGCTPTCKISICGDGILQPGEECDDGARNSDTKPDSCSTKCLLPHCGDGIIDRAFGEICDDGYNNSNTRPNGCRLNCVPAHCGDGVQDTGEQCDNGAKNSDVMPGACRTNCKIAHCGDGVVDPGEQCDGGPHGSASCTPDCKAITILHGAAPADYSWAIVALVFLALLIIALIAVRTAHKMMKS